MMYLGDQAVGINISQNYKIVSGTFIGNDTYEHSISCPFKPDVYIVWTDDVINNPGKEGLLSIAEMRGNRMMSMRFISDTSVSPTVGGSAFSSTDYYRSNYANGIMVVCAGANSSFQFYAGTTYKYIFAKDLISNEGGDT